MKAPLFQYVRPTALVEVLELLSKYESGAKLLAGGQSLMPTLNMRLSAPELLIDINLVDGLTGIAVDGSVLRIGAMTRQIELEENPLVTQYAPLIAQAVPHIGHVAVRNRGTIGGSLAFADPAAELPACAIALNASYVLERLGERRTIAASAFYQGLYATALRHDEILTAIEVPIGGQDKRHGFLELARRHGDYAMLGLAATATLDGDTFNEATLVFFGAYDRPFLAEEMGTALRGKRNDSRTWEAAAAMVDHLADPLEDLNANSTMRRHLAKVLTRRVLSCMTS
jgi:aerobic carbon-monoxide dehydrogenase medium subunit